VSVRLVAMSTLTDARWGTRGPVQARPSTTGRLARLRSVMQPAGLVVAPVSWPSSALSQLQPGPDGKRPRFDGAWRAGVSQTMMAHPTRMMAHPVSSSDQVGPTVAPFLIATAAPPMRAVDQPLGPTCRHAVRAGARFCRACGAPYVAGNAPAGPAAGQPTTAAAIDGSPSIPFRAPSSSASKGPSIERWNRQLDRLARIDPMSVWPVSSAVRSAGPLASSQPASAKRSRKSAVGRSAGPVSVSTVETGPRGTRAASKSQKPTGRATPAETRVAKPARSGATAPKAASPAKMSKPAGRRAADKPTPKPEPTAKISRRRATPAPTPKPQLAAKASRREAKGALTSRSGARAS
jgi:hypothetical protein